MHCSQSNNTERSTIAKHITASHSNGIELALFKRFHGDQEYLVGGDGLWGLGGMLLGALP